MARPTKKRYNRIQKWCPHLKKKKAVHTHFTEQTAWV